MNNTPFNTSENPFENKDYLVGDLSSVSYNTPLTGKIGEASSAGNNATENETLDTLDEPVLTTLMRDLKAIWKKVLQVLFPFKQDRKKVLQDWDLWGPLVLCLVLSVILSFNVPTDQATQVFAGIFVIVWCGAAVVTLNSKLLGGKISFFQSVCVLGYCIFPLVVAAIVTRFFTMLLIRAIVCGCAFAWSIYASIGFLSDAKLNERRALAVYPVFLFYFAISWMVGCI